MTRPRPPSLSFASRRLRAETAGRQGRTRARRRLSPALDPAARARARAPAAIILAVDRRRPDPVLQGHLVGGLRVRGLAGLAPMRVAPLLLIAVGLIVVFKAGIWNLGMDGQFLLAAAVIAGIGPRLEHHLPNTINLMLLFLIAGAVGAAWTIPPALLKARYELNEIITTLMMSLHRHQPRGRSSSRGRSRTRTTTTPQTRAFDFDALLPSIPGTRVDIASLAGHPRRAARSARRRGRRLVPDEPDLVRAPARRARRVRALRPAHGPRRATADRRLLPPLRACSSASPPRPRSSASRDTCEPTGIRPSGCGWCRSCFSRRLNADRRHPVRRRCSRSSPSAATSRRRTPG